MSPPDRPSHDPDAGADAIDRELRAIRFRERASFASELRRRLLASDVRAARSRRLTPLAAAVASLGLGLLQLTSTPPGRAAHPASSISQPVVVCMSDEVAAHLCPSGAVADAALYLTVNSGGTVLQLARERSAGSSVGYSQAAFACAFDRKRALCGEPGMVEDSLLGPRVARGPFLYRDICCSSYGRDGGGDGVLTVSGLRDAVVFVFLYADVNGDGRLSAGDRLRLRLHPPGPEPRETRYASRDEATGRNAGMVTASSERPMSVVAY